MRAFIYSAKSFAHLVIIANY